MSLGTWLNRILLHPSPAERMPTDALLEMRFSVLDLDVTGTVVSRDSVWGIALLPVETASFRVSDIKYYDVPAHGPGMTGDFAPWRKDYSELAQIMAGSVIVTYNVRFVRAMMEKLCASFGLEPPSQEWMEITAFLDEWDTGDSAVTNMSYWLQKMQRGPRRPHDAVYDVHLMAQMLLAVLAYSEESGHETLETVVRNNNARTWLRG